MRNVLHPFQTFMKFSVRLKFPTTKLQNGKHTILPIFSVYILVMNNFGSKCGSGHQFHYLLHRKTKSTYHHSALHHNPIQQWSPNQLFCRQQPSIFRALVQNQCQHKPNNIRYAWYQYTFFSSKKLRTGDSPPVS